MTERWQNVSAGPRQIDDLNRAVSVLRSEGQTRDELTGVIGGQEHRTALQSPFGPVRPEVAALDEKIRAAHGRQVTRANVRGIIAEYEAALREARQSRPTDDQRRTAGEDAELRAKVAAREAGERAERDARNALLAQVLAKAPPGAQALITAEYHEDASDIQADYHGSRTARTVAIGWRFSAREDFRALRDAAAHFPETAHLASEDTLRTWQAGHGGRARGELEHRDNYSMGMGNYLSDHGLGTAGTGWIVRSASLPCSYVHLTEDALPAAVGRTPAAGDGPGTGPVTVCPSSLGKLGVIELRFADRPGDDVLDALKKGAGFRWARHSRCWYGRQADYMEAVASGWPLPPLPASGPAS